ncbi:hypothetical protein HDU83_006260 [Entophlyctis luteolus]|nr:hypothetical protein HDU83_006260 [Entophlyctis luteolus]
MASVASGLPPRLLRRGMAAASGLAGSVSRAAASQLAPSSSSPSAAADDKSPSAPTSSSRRLPLSTLVGELGWGVNRSHPSGWLPVYREYRRSHNLVKETIITKVVGNPNKMLVDLQKALKTSGGRVKTLNKHVVLSGDHLHAVRDYLTQKGGESMDDSRPSAASPASPIASRQPLHDLPMRLYPASTATVGESSSGGSSNNNPFAFFATFAIAFLAIAMVDLRSFALAIVYLALGVAAGFALIQYASSLSSASSPILRVPPYQASSATVTDSVSNNSHNVSNYVSTPPSLPAEVPDASAVPRRNQRSHSNDIAARRQSDARRRRRNEVARMLSELEREVASRSAAALPISEASRNASQLGEIADAAGDPVPDLAPAVVVSQPPSPTFSIVSPQTPSRMGVFISSSNRNSPVPPPAPLPDSLQSGGSFTTASTSSSTPSSAFPPPTPTPAEGSGGSLGLSAESMISLRQNRVSFVDHTATADGVNQLLNDEQLFFYEGSATAVDVATESQQMASPVDVPVDDSLESGVDIDKLLAELDANIANDSANEEASNTDSDFDEDLDGEMRGIGSETGTFLDHILECKNLVSLLNSISEDQARKDYDLCDLCENLGDVHTKTHTFVKIRIPLAPHANLMGATAQVMYPGKEIMLWNRNEEVEKLGGISHFESVEIHALFEQFLSLATIPPTEGCPGGISRETFDLCLSALGKEKNLITDRIFSFFDQDGDECISFKEFVIGLGVMIKGSLDERIENAFKGYDIDGDGKISRQELHRMFKAYFYLSMQLVRDYVKTVEQEMMDTFDDEAAKPVSASFTAPIPSSGGASGGAGVGDEDQTHLKVRGNEGMIGPADGTTAVGHRNSAKVAMKHQDENRRLSAVLQPVTTAPIPRNNSSSSSSSGTSSGSLRELKKPLTIDVERGKTAKGKLPSALLDNKDASAQCVPDVAGNCNSSNNVATPLSTVGILSPLSVTGHVVRRSGSPISTTSGRSVSPTYFTPTAAQFPSIGRLSGTVTTTTTATSAGSDGVLSRGTRVLQEVQALRRRSNMSLRSGYRDSNGGVGGGALSGVGSSSSSVGFHSGLYGNAGDSGGGWQSPVSPFEDLLAGSSTTISSRMFTEEQQLPVIEAMSQDAIEEMVERTFAAAGAANGDYITLEEFRRAVEQDHSYLQWFEALGSVF